MGIPELPLNRLAILGYLEEQYLRRLVLYTNPNALLKPPKYYHGIVNRINVEVDAEEVKDCTMTVQIGETRVETSVLTFIHNTVRNGDLQPGTADNG